MAKASITLPHLPINLSHSSPLWPCLIGQGLTAALFKAHDPDVPPCFKFGSTRQLNAGVLMLGKGELRIGTMLSNCLASDVDLLRHAPGDNPCCNILKERSNC